MTPQWQQAQLSQENNTRPARSSKPQYNNMAEEEQRFLQVWLRLVQGMCASSSFVAEKLWPPSTGPGSLATQTSLSLGRMSLAPPSIAPAPGTSIRPGDWVRQLARVMRFRLHMSLKAEIVRSFNALAMSSDALALRVLALVQDEEVLVSSLPQVAAPSRFASSDASKLRCTDIREEFFTREAAAKDYPLSTAFLELAATCLTRGVSLEAVVADNATVSVSQPSSSQQPPPSQQQQQQQQQQFGQGQGGAGMPSASATSSLSSPQTAPGGALALPGIAALQRGGFSSFPLASGAPGTRSAGPSSDAHPKLGGGPAQGGADLRKGPLALIQFACFDVFLSSEHRQYAHAGERWQVAAHAMRMMLMAIESFPADALAAYEEGDVVVRRDVAASDEHSLSPGFLLLSHLLAGTALFEQVMALLLAGGGEQGLRDAMAEVSVTPLAAGGSAGIASVSAVSSGGGSSAVLGFGSPSASALAIGGNAGGPGSTAGPRSASRLPWFGAAANHRWTRTSSYSTAELAQNQRRTSTSDVPGVAGAHAGGAHFPGDPLQNRFGLLSMRSPLHPTLTPGGTAAGSRATVRTSTGHTALNKSANDGGRFADWLEATAAGLDTVPLPADAASPLSSSSSRTNHLSAGRSTAASGPAVPTAPFSPQSPWHNGDPGAQWRITATKLALRVLAAVARRETGLLDLLSVHGARVYPMERLHKLLLSRGEYVEAIASFVRCSVAPELQLLAVTLLQHMNERASHLSVMRVLRRSGQHALLSLRAAMVDCLQAVGSLAGDATGAIEAANEDWGHLAALPVLDSSREARVRYEAGFDRASLRALPNQVLDLLLSGMRFQSDALPQFLLGLDDRTSEANTTVLGMPAAMGGDSMDTSCLQAIVSQLSRDFGSTRVTLPQAYREKAFALVASLCTARTDRGRLVLKMLRASSLDRQGFWQRALAHVSSESPSSSAAIVAFCLRALSSELEVASRESIGNAQDIVRGLVERSSTTACFQLLELLDHVLVSWLAGPDQGLEESLPSFAAPLIRRIFAAASAAAASQSLLVGPGAERAAPRSVGIQSGDVSRLQGCVQIRFFDYVNTRFSEFCLEALKRVATEEIGNEAAADELVAWARRWNRSNRARCEVQFFTQSWANLVEDIVLQHRRLLLAPNGTWDEGDLDEVALDLVGSILRLLTKRNPAIDPGVSEPLARVALSLIVALRRSRGLEQLGGDSFGRLLGSTVDALLVQRGADSLLSFRCQLLGAVLHLLHASRELGTQGREAAAVTLDVLQTDGRGGALMELALSLALGAGGREDSFPLLQGTALAVIAALLPLDRDDQWLSWMRRRGVLQRLAEDTIGAIVYSKLGALLDHAAPVAVFEACISVLIHVASASRNGMMALIDADVMGSLSKQGPLVLLCDRRAVEVVAAEVRQAHPSERRHALVLPLLRLVLQIASAGDEALRPTLRLLRTQRRMVTASLGFPHASHDDVREATMLASLLALVATSPEEFHAELGEVVAEFDSLAFGCLRELCARMEARQRQWQRQRQPHPHQPQRALVENRESEERAALDVELLLALVGYLRARAQAALARDEVLGSASAAEIAIVGMAVDLAAHKLIGAGLNLRAERGPDGLGSGSGSGSVSQAPSEIVRGAEQQQSGVGASSRSVLVTADDGAPLRGDFGLVLESVLVVVLALVRPLKSDAGAVRRVLSESWCTPREQDASKEASPLERLLESTDSGQWNFVHALLRQLRAMQYQ